MRGASILHWENICDEGANVPTSPYPRRVAYWVSRMWIAYVRNPPKDCSHYSARRADLLRRSYTKVFAIKHNLIFHYYLMNSIYFLWHPSVQYISHRLLSKNLQRSRAATTCDLTSPECPHHAPGSTTIPTVSTPRVNHIQPLGME